MAATQPQPTSVSRAASALLATGAFLMLIGIVFLFPFLLNPRAQENDVFLTNLFLGVFSCGLGSTILICGFAGLGISPWRVLTLAIANPATIALALWLLAISGLGGLTILTAALVGDAIAVLLVATFLAATRHHLAVWGRAFLLALAGSALVTLAYALFGSRYLAFGETASSLPPYLDWPILAISLVLAVLVLFAARAWRTS